MTKVAYLYLTHHDPELLARFGRFVSFGQGLVYVHVDAKVDYMPFRNAVRDLSNVKFIDHRIGTYWGDYTYVEAVVETMRTALSDGPYLDRFVVVQGSDYPIHPEWEIEEFFDSNRDVNFINAYDVMARDDRADVNKYLLKWDLKDRSMTARAGNKLKSTIGRACPRLFTKKANYIRLSDGKTMRIYSGWAHFSLTREVVEYVVSFHDTHPEFNDYFHSVCASDESYFHTIFWNSVYAESNIVPRPYDHWEHSLMLNNTYFEYPDVVREWRDAGEYAELLKTGKLLFRKVNSVRGKALLDAIDEASAR